ncbi:MAG: hypothetical protein II918_06165 [Firmicutes bacterium]|nr:hypothetical protein [Bacillota bacterium]
MNSTKNNTNNFIKELAIYGGVTLFFLAPAIGSRVINWNLGQAQQMSMLANIVLAAGFIIYLRMADYKMDLNPRIIDKGALYWVCLWISLIVISNFYRPDLGWANNIPLNLVLIIETLFIAVADETVFRAFGDLIFSRKGLKEEAAMIFCYVVFYSFSFVDGITAGITAVALAIGIGTLFTGLYLRYRKLGANVIYHFVLIYLMRLTAINSTSDTPVLGKAAMFIFALGILGMIWYGIKLIKAYNAEGVFDDFGMEDDDPAAQLKKAFSESRDKYKEKIITKAEPKVEKNVERYIQKQNALAEKQQAKLEAKENAKRGKKK